MYMFPIDKHHEKLVRNNANILTQNPNVEESNDVTAVIVNGCCWGHMFLKTFPAADLEIMWKYHAPKCCVDQSGEPAYDMFIQRILLNNNKVKLDFKKFMKWIYEHELHEKARDPSWMIAFSRIVENGYWRRLGEDGE